VRICFRAPFLSIKECALNCFSLFNWNPKGKPKVTVLLKFYSLPKTKYFDIHVKKRKMKLSRSYTCWWSKLSAQLKFPAFFGASSSQKCFIRYYLKLTETAHTGLACVTAIIHKAVVITFMIFKVHTFYQTLWNDEYFVKSWSFFSVTLTLEFDYLCFSTQHIFFFSIFFQVDIQFTVFGILDGCTVYTRLGWMRLFLFSIGSRVCNLSWHHVVCLEECSTICSSDRTYILWTEIHAIHPLTLDLIIQ